MANIVLPQVDRITTINKEKTYLLVEQNGQINRLNVNHFTSDKLDSIEENANNFQLTNNSIQNSHLSANAVTTDKLDNNSVTNEKIADESISLQKLSADIKGAFSSSIQYYKGILRADGWVSESGTSDLYKNMENKWKWERFASVTMADSIKTTLATSKPAEIRYFHDKDTAINMNITDSYTARCTTYVYAVSDINFPCQACTDDNGRVFCNGTLVGSITSCTVTNITLPLKKGVNCIEVYYTEGSGGDGWYFSPKLYERIGYELYAMCAAPAASWSQTITPECLTPGENKLNANTILSPAIMRTDDYSDAEYRNRINSGFITHDDAGTITVHYLSTVPIDKDLEVYWFGQNFD